LPLSSHGGEGHDLEQRRIDPTLLFAATIVTRKAETPCGSGRGPLPATGA
jgi:hypothetical protein